MRSKTKTALFIGTILTILGVMIVTPWGSTNPAEVGFYTSIGTGLLSGVLMYFALKKFWVNP